MSPTPHSSQDLIRALLAEGWTRSQIAAAVGRNSRMIGFVLSGDKPGRNLAPALEELLNSGVVTTPPPRRRSANGQIVKVRGRDGHLVTPRQARRRAPASTQPPTSRPRQPTPTGTGRQPQFGPASTIGQGPNRFNVTSHTTPGSTKEHHEITVPRRNSAWNRWQGSETLKQILERARNNGRRFHAFVIVEVGPPGQRTRRNVKLGGKGGYDPASALVGIANDGLVWDWLRNQVEGRYPELAPGDSSWTVIGLDLDIW